MREGRRDRHPRLDARPAVRPGGRRPGGDPRPDHPAAGQRRGPGHAPGGHARDPRPRRLDLRPLETLASHTARALDGLRQVEEIRRLNQSLEEHAEELVKSEAALREQTRILQSVLDCMGEGVVVADREARFLVFNPAAERILGQGRARRRAERLVPPLRRSTCPIASRPIRRGSAPDRAIRGESLDQAELYIAHPSLQDGPGCWSTPARLRDEQGESRAAWSSSTTSPGARRTSGGWPPSTRRPGSWPRSIRSNEATPQILETIGRQLDWDFGAFWRVDHGEPRAPLRRRIWEPPASRLSPASRS